MEGSPTWICDWSMAGVCHSSLASTSEAALFTTQCSLDQGGEVSRGQQRSPSSSLHHDPITLSLAPPCLVPESLTTLATVSPSLSTQSSRVTSNWRTTTRRPEEKRNIDIKNKIFSPTKQLAT